MKINNKEISSIEVFYFIPSKIIESKSFPPNIKFQDIIDYFISNIQNENKNLELKENYSYKKNEINESTIISDLFDEKSIPESGKLNIYIELINVQDNNKISYILKPKNNQFGIISFSTNLKEIKLENFDENIITTNNLDKYSPEFSAYCNSNNSLFISGGVDKKRKPLNDFWIINYNYNNSNSDKGSYEIKNIKMPYEKKEHSMIYNKLDDTIIIVGGNDKKCFIYDIKSDKFLDLPGTNDICIKPALIIKNNYLYVFDSFERKKKFFEKLNLEKKENFEKFSPKGYSLNNNKYFGICESNNVDNIIFCGGERTGTNTIIYEIKNNNLLKTKGKDINCKLDDKTFYKLNQNFYINIPYSKDLGEKSIIAFDRRTNDAFKIMFDKQGKTTFKFDIKEENDISIEPIIENKKLSESVNIINSKEVNHEKIEDNDKIISQSVNIFNNNLNINNTDKKINTNKNANIDNDNDNTKGKMLYTFKNSPRKYISGKSFNEDSEKIKNQNIINNIQEEKDNINNNIEEGRKVNKNIMHDNNQMNNNMENVQNKGNNVEIKNNIKIITDKEKNNNEEENESKKDILKNQNIYKTPINPKFYPSQDFYGFRKNKKSKYY